MNCDQAGEKLIDLVYGELADADEQPLREHVRQCSKCREELKNLQMARSAMSQYRRSEPKGVPRLRRARLSEHVYRRRFAVAAGVAAVALIALSVWMLQEKTTTPARAEILPVEIERLGVSLTILSEPENRPGYRYRQWKGLALVRDKRIARHLKKGVNEVRFTDVPAGILPETVRLRSLDDADAMSILEQNYQYDLASADAVLTKHVDKTVSVLFKDGEAASGKLLSFDGNALVIRPEGQGPRNISRERLKAISFEELPEGLLTTPTLMWKLHNAAAAKQQFEVAYMTGGLTWRADYVLKLRPATKEARSLPVATSARESAIRNPQSAIVDFASIVGYATVTNNSGVTYQDAQLKLLAGDVNLIRPLVAANVSLTFESGGGGGPQFQEKSFFEYHLYTLGRATTIRSAETKQIELVSGSGVKLKRGYVYDPRDNPTAVRVVSEMVNSEANGLGKPLPKGVVRLYAPDPEGIATYVAETTIDHTPKDEKLRFPWGYAFDITCGHSVRDSKHSGDEHYQKRRYTVRNRKDYDVSVTVIARVPKTTYKGECNFPWHVREVGVVEITVPVKANSQADAMLSVYWNDARGGGLTSPYDGQD